VKFSESSLNSNSNRATCKEYFGCLESGFDSVGWFVFFEFMASFSLGGHNFLISNPLLTIVSVSDASRGGVQILF